MTPQLEICAADMHSVHAAADGGANRVELCSGLAEGGMTPSAGFVAAALKVPGIRVHVLIRPRPGDFLYNEEEVDAMIADIKLMRSIGAHGVVIGALTPDGDVDVNVCAKLMAEAGKMSVTFHRAFDLVRSPKDALEQIMELGCDRILTSGCAASALQGAQTLADLQKQADDRLIILAGGGVSPDNAAEIMQKSGVHELHASARAPLASGMRHKHEGVSMGAAGNDEYTRITTNSDIVKQIAQAMRIKQQQ